MNYEEKYKLALSWATFYNSELPTKEQRKMLEVIFPELAADNEDERIRNKLICFVENWKNFNPNSPFDDYAVYTSDSGECDKILAWLEKQGEQKTDPCTDCSNDKGCVTCEHGELRETTTRTLNADKVIAWLVANICEFDYYVKRFKEDFGL